MQSYVIRDPLIKTVQSVLNEAGKIACLECDNVSTEAAWKKNRGSCPKCKTSSNGVVEETLDEAKFGPQSQANKLAWAKSNVKEYKRSLENAIAKKKDADTIAHWKKQLANATKEFAALQAKKESIDEQSSPHVPTPLLSKASKLGFRAGSIEKIYEIVYRQLNDEAGATKTVDKFLTGLHAMPLTTKQIQSISQIVSSK